MTMFKKPHVVSIKPVSRTKKFLLAATFGAFFATSMSFGDTASAQSSLSGSELYFASVSKLNKQLGSVDSGINAPSLNNADTMQLYKEIEQGIEGFGTAAFPVSGIDTFERVCAPLNEASVKHLFVGAAAIKALKDEPAIQQKKLGELFAANSVKYQDYVTILTAANVKCMALHLPFLAEFVRNLKPEEMTEVRLGGLRQMRQGGTNTIFGFIAYLVNPGYSTANMQRAATAATRYAPAYVATMPLAQRATVLSQLKSLKANVKPQFLADYSKIELAFSSTDCRDLCLIQ
jgi:hypothetical protein